MRLLLALLLQSACGMSVDPRIKAACAEVSNPAVCERVHQADLEQVQARATGSIAERCQASTNPALCTVLGEQAEAEVAASQPPQVIYEPVYRPQPIQRPAVVVPGQHYVPLQPGLLPNTYYQPGVPGMFTVQPLP
jgi:hypothetical protein